MYIEELPSGKYKCVQSYKDYLTGKNKKISVCIEKNTIAARREAEWILQKKIEKLQKGYIEKDSYTLAEIIEKYRIYQKNTVKLSTYNRNRFAENALMRIFDQDTLVDKFSASFVRERLTATGEANSTINERLSRMKALFRWAYQEELVDDIRWVDRVKPFPDIVHKKKIENKYLEGAELKELLDHVNLPTHKRFFLFLSLSGLRSGEAIALTVDDINLKERTITVNKTFDQKNKIVTSVKTFCSDREVFIQEELLPLIKDILAYNKALQMSTGIRSNLLFFDLRGEHVNYYTYNKYYKKHTDKLFGRPLTLHSLRHTHASLMFEKGMTLEAISERLGHSNSAITKEVYLHTTKKKKAEYYKQIDLIKIL